MHHHHAFSVAWGGGRRRLRWVHAANTERQLRAALEDEAVDAVEVDVCTLPSSGGERKAYAVHPPAVEADMTAERLIDIVHQSSTEKIVKLDLKCDDVIGEVVDLLLRSWLTDVTPLVLNSDVVAWSDSSPAPVSAETLLSHHSRLGDSLIPPVVSLGWCPPPSGGDVTLSSRHVSEMAALARDKPATLAIRADVALASERGLATLLGDLPGCGVTLWAHPCDPVNPEALERLVRGLEGNAVPVWVDVPETMLPRSVSETYRLSNEVVRVA